MASVYILFSPRLNRFYTGSCLNLEQRILNHKDKTYNKAYTTVTDDWELYFDLSDLDGKIAKKIEAYIKSMKSKKYIENLKKHPEMCRRLVSKFSNI